MLVLRRVPPAALVPVGDAIVVGGVEVGADIEVNVVELSTSIAVEAVRPGVELVEGSDPVSANVSEVVNFGYRVAEAPDAFLGFTGCSIN